LVPGRSSTANDECPAYRSRRAQFRHARSVTGDTGNNSSMQIFRGNSLLVGTRVPTQVLIAQKSSPIHLPIEFGGRMIVNGVT